MVLLFLRFRAASRISGLPPFHGAQWSAVFRHALKGYGVTWDPKAFPLWPVPIEGGVAAYDEGDPIHVGLVFSSNLAPAVGAMLAGINDLRTVRGQFQPGVTILFEEAFCRITGDRFDPANPAVLDDTMIAEEVERLSSLPRFTLRFLTPLRVTRPAGEKEESHRYCDEEYFFGKGSEALSIVASRVRSRAEGMPALLAASVTGGALTWIGVRYGDDKLPKSLGGVTGTIVCEGRQTRENASRLVAGQYAGSGRNPAFGFGFYTIPELDGVRRVRPLTRG